MADNLNKKIQKIDKLLEDDSLLEKYINDIEVTQISYPDKLEDKILSKVNKKKQIKYTSILKMAACMILALILCQTDFIKNANFANKQENYQVAQKQSYLDEKVNQFSNFFMKPIILEKGDK